MVYVISKSGKPLIPTERHGKVRRLLKDGKAKVINRKPFTIQLLYQTETEIVQEVTLGVDSGYLNIGLSAITEKKELFSAEIQLRKNIVQLLEDRRMYRRTRRNHLWYRQPRWSNRKRIEKWLAPSIQHKLDSHLRIIEKVKSILPISKIVVEVVNFDIQLIKNPEISGVDYQNGEQKGFFNLREYILYRDNYTCQKCKAKNVPLEVHHLGYWKRDHTDRPSNLITLCLKCHAAKNHKQDSFLWGWKPKLKSFKAETFMSTVRWKMMDQLREINHIPIEHTYGNITKFNRIQQGIEKSHINDAFIIAYGTDQKRIEGFTVTQVRRNNRKLQTNRKGFKPSIRRKRYQFQPKDLVNFDNQICEVKGMVSYGRYVVLKNKFGNKIIGKRIKNIKTQNVKILKYQKGFAFGI